MKPSAAIVVGLLLALLRGGDVLGADTDGPVVVDVPEQPVAQAITAPEKGSSIAEIPPAAETPPLPQEQSGPDSLGQQGAGYDPLNPPPPPAVLDLHSLREFLDQMTETSPLGVELREDRTNLRSGETINGLAVVSVAEGSPAAHAGLRPYSGATHAVLEGATMAATLVFPPAIVALTIIDQTHIGESYDLIIGVDGTRVCDLLQFEDQTRGLKPGETVYLNIVRDGARLQIPVNLPLLTQASK
jgi:hypothetical protein